MNLNEKIIKLRAKNNFSQQDLADKVFVSRQAVQKWEKGKAVPSIDVLKQLSKLFNVTVDYLIDDDQPLEEHLAKEDAVPRVAKVQEVVPQPKPKKSIKGPIIKLVVALVVIGGIVTAGCLVYKAILAKEEQTKQEAYTASVTKNDFKFRYQYTTNNTCLCEFTPNYPMRDLTINVLLSSNLLNSYTSTRSYQTVVANQAYKFKIDNSEVNKKLNNESIKDVIFSASGKKQQKYAGVKQEVDYSKISFECEVTTNSNGKSSIVPYFISNYDGLILGAKEMNFICEYGGAQVKVTRASKGSLYLRKGEKVKIDGKFNTEITGTFPSNTVKIATCKEVISADIYYGPKAGSSVIPFDTNINDQVILSEFVRDNGRTFEVELVLALDITQLRNLQFYVGNKKTDKIEKVDIIARPFLYSECVFFFDRTEAQDLDFGDQMPTRLTGEIVVPYETNGYRNISYYSDSTQSAFLWKKQIALAGSPIPIVEEPPQNSPKQFYGWYYDNDFKKFLGMGDVMPDEDLSFYGETYSLSIVPVVTIK